MEKKVFPVPFTLPDGRTVLLDEWSEADFESITMWVRKRYTAIGFELLKVLPQEDQFNYQLSIVNYSFNLDFQNGLGRDLLMESTRGMSLAVYLLIDNPPFTFEQFYNMVFPADTTEIRINGIRLLTEIMDTVYDGFSVIEKQIESEKESNKETVTPNEEDKPAEEVKESEQV